MSTKDIPDYLESLKKNFAKRTSYPTVWRKQQINNLCKGMIEMKKEMCRAMKEDMGREEFFTELVEVMVCIEFCTHTVDYLDAHMKDVECDPSIVFAPSHSKLRFEPLGVALIMGSWNYPYFVTLKPLIQSIAAGNCAIVKPSELAPCSAKIIQVLVEKYLDPNCFKVVQGGAETAIALTNSHFDIICFTGSTEKGKLVAKAAAQNLTPCILELGGKCPVILDDSTNLSFAAFKICAGKF